MRIPLRIAVIGQSAVARDILHILEKNRGVEIKVLLTVGGEEASTLKLLRERGIMVAKELSEIVNDSHLDLIIVAGEDEALASQLRNKVPPRVEVTCFYKDHLLNSLLAARQKLMDTQEVKDELLSILNSVEEGIQVVDISGTIKYVNPAFIRITKVNASERIGRNINEVSPDGVLAQVLKTRQPLLGVRTKAKGSDVEVVVNTFPIMSEGKMIGAVSVFQDVSDILKLSRELSRSTTLLENLYDKIGDLTKARYRFSDLVGHSKALTDAITLASRCADGDSTVLLTGESGTGKELFAHAIHNASNRRQRAFIRVNCAAIPENLLESEFFGYEKGAFTGAVHRKIGTFELANHGSIFLDEIGDMSLALQAKLLRVLQDGEFQRIGGTETIRTDVRVIAATNRDLGKLIEQGRFRRDLYYRLNVMRIDIPPLRERKEDIPDLVNHILSKLSRKLGKKIKGISGDALELLRQYEWPGNIRELENVLERAVNLMSESEPVITKKLLLSLESFERPASTDHILPLNQVEKQMIIRALKEFGSNSEGKRKASQALNISLATLYNKIKRYQIVV